MNALLTLAGFLIVSVTTGLLITLVDYDGYGGFFFRLLKYSGMMALVLAGMVLVLVGLLLFGYGATQMLS